MKSSDNTKAISPAEYLKKRIKVWCHNRNEWEIDELTILPKGDFIDRKNRLHRKENHTAYVTLDDALKAMEILKTNLIKERTFPCNIEGIRAGKTDFSDAGLLKRIIKEIDKDAEWLLRYQSECISRALNGEIGMGPLWNLDNRTNEDNEPESNKDTNP